MRKSILTLSVAAALATPGLAAAQAAAPAAAPAPSPITGNMTIVSDYRFRGISQTYLGPAIQGGIDYAHPSGFYIGNWNSSVASQVFTFGSGIEMDFYGGYKKSFGDIGLDVGYIYYYYHNAEWNPAVGSTLGSSKFNNQEVYIGASWKWLSAKLNYAISDYFGLNTDMAAGGYFVDKTTGAPLDPSGTMGKSKGTYYLDITATYPVSDKFSVIGHYGMLNVKTYNDLDYNDWKLGVTYDMSGWILGAAYIDTDAKNNWYYTAGSKGLKDTGNGTVVLSVGKTF
jgi:uncharacterized protein (TIGR02001 family)